MSAAFAMMWILIYAHLNFQETKKNDDSASQEFSDSLSSSRLIEVYIGSGVI
jgi:hypothetical protein